MQVAHNHAATDWRRPSVGHSSKFYRVAATRRDCEVFGQNVLRSAQTGIERQLHVSMSETEVAGGTLIGFVNGVDDSKWIEEGSGQG